MDLARIVGSVVATRKSAALAGVKICVIQPVDHSLEPSGETLIAVDATANRGRGELVYYVISAEAAFATPEDVRMPVDAAICGIVDHLALDARRGP